MQSDTAVAQSTLSRPGEAQASGDLKEGTSVEKPKKRRISGDRAALKARVITTMKAIIHAHKAKRDYDPSAAIKSGRGAKVLIEEYTPQAEVVYRVMESGMRLGNTVVVLNQWRRRRTLEPISYGFL